MAITNIYALLGVSVFSEPNMIQNSINQHKKAESLPAKALMAAEQWLLVPETRVQYDTKLKAEYPALFAVPTTTTPTSKPELQELLNKYMHKPSIKPTLAPAENRAEPHPKKPVKFVILDTETTGLDSRAEIIEIAIITDSGDTLIDTYIKPHYRIDEYSEAVRIHGITNATVAKAPTWHDVYAQIREILISYPVVIYNAPFDLRMLEQTSNIYGCRPLPINAQCAMREYGDFYSKQTGEGYRRHSLANALQQTNNQFKGQAHSAKTDCLAVLDLINHMGIADEIGATKQTLIASILNILNQEWYILDINHGSQFTSKMILQIALADHNSTLILSSLISPKRRSLDFNKITSPNPTFSDFYDVIKANVEGKNVFMFEATKTMNLLNAECKRYKLPQLNFNFIDLETFFRKRINKLAPLLGADEVKKWKIKGFDSQSNVASTLRCLKNIKYSLIKHQ